MLPSHRPGTRRSPPRSTAVDHRRDWQRPTTLRVSGQRSESFVHCFAHSQQRSLIRNPFLLHFPKNDGPYQPGPIGPEGGRGGYGIGGSVGGGGGSGSGSGSSRLTGDTAAPTRDNDVGLSFISSLSSENSLSNSLLRRMVVHSSRMGSTRHPSTDRPKPRNQGKAGSFRLASFHLSASNCVLEIPYT
jgi:hypothetical protein